MKVLFCDEKEPEGKSIADIFPESFFHTNLWLTLQNMLAFKRYRSAIEAKRYFRRFTHFMPESDYLRSFMPRNISDRSKVVPEGCKNLAFIGQYVKTPEDAVFTVETSCARVCTRRMRFQVWIKNRWRSRPPSTIYVISLNNPKRFRVSKGI